MVDPAAMGRCCYGCGRGMAFVLSVNHLSLRSAQWEIPPLILALRPRFASKEGGMRGDFPAGKLNLHKEGL